MGGGGSKSESFNLEVLTQKLGEFYYYLEIFLILKGLGVISSNPPCKDGSIGRSKTVSFKALSEQ